MWHQVVNVMLVKSTDRVSVSRLCELFGVSKQAYYKRLGAEQKHPADLDSTAVSFVRQKRAIAPRIGCKKLWVMFQKEYLGQYSVGRDRFYEIMRSHHLLLPRKCHRVRTTDSRHKNPLAPNLIKDLIPTAPHQIWVSDITYIPIILDGDKHDYYYLSLIMDAYTKLIEGWHLSRSLETRGTLMALREAVTKLDASELSGLIHHSDRGTQYTSKEYTDYLRQHQISISMTESGNPKENAEAERLNNTIKNELLCNERFYSFDSMYRSIKRAIEFFNTERPHLSLNMMTPAEASRCTGEQTLLWRSFRRNAIKRKHAAEGRVSEISSTPAGAPSGLRPSVSPAGVVPVQSNRKE